MSYTTDLILDEQERAAERFTERRTYPSVRFETGWMPCRQKPAQPAVRPQVVPVVLPTLSPVMQTRAMTFALRNVMNIKNGWKAEADVSLKQLDALLEGYLLATEGTVRSDVLGGLRVQLIELAYSELEGLG